MSGPYAFRLHVVAWALLIGVAAIVVVLHRRAVRTGGVGTAPWPPRQIAAWGGALGAAAVALTWPLADLAAHWSLTALVFQRLLLVLAVAPLAMAGLPYDVVARLTRPRLVDALLDRCRRPLVAVAVFSVVAVGSFTVPLVQAQARSPVARAVLDAVVLAAGVVLWLPVIGRVPGILRLRPFGRLVYLVVQAVLPAFLSFIYIFARHPFYPCFSGSHRALGVAPLNDQQIAGFVSKIGMLTVLIASGAVVLSRAQRTEEDEAAHEPLMWADVEREIERADRRRYRHGRAGAGGDGDPG